MGCRVFYVFPVIGVLAVCWQPILALQVYQDAAIEGYDPCDSSTDSGISNIQDVATKPPSDTDPADYERKYCGTPVQHCRDPVDVEAACREMSGCVAFNYDGRCGYLKTAAEPRSQRGGWSVYVLDAPSGNTSTGSLPTSASSPSTSQTPSSGRKLLNNCVHPVRS